MISNIVDCRTRKYRWKRVRVIAEATWHDNSVADSDQATPSVGEVDYDELDDVSLAEGIAWAQAIPGDVTLFIYDAPEVDIPTSP
jgi:hypothetical protein